MGLGVRDKLGNRLGWDRWIHHHDLGLAVDACDRRDVVDEIEIELLIQGGVDRVRHADQQQRVAVCWRTYHRLGADIAATAWPVLDDERLAKPLGPGGSCPFGYTSSGSFCTPSQGAQDAVAKPSNGTCPFGWMASGSYCLRTENVQR